MGKYTRKGKDQYGWCNNLKGFIPYRYMIDNKKNIIINGK